MGILYKLATLCCDGRAFFHDRMEVKNIGYGRYSQADIHLLTFLRNKIPIYELRAIKKGKKVVKCLFSLI